ncbi:hypothetical protein C1646_771820, partial [Rhizophagus diaphanus]
MNNSIKSKKPKMVDLIKSKKRALSPNPNSFQQNNVFDLVNKETDSSQSNNNKNIHTLFSSSPLLLNPSYFHIPAPDENKDNDEYIHYNEKEENDDNEDDGDEDDGDEDDGDEDDGDENNGNEDNSDENDGNKDNGDENNGAENNDGEDE